MTNGVRVKLLTDDEMGAMYEKGVEFLSKQGMFEMFLNLRVPCESVCAGDGELVTHLLDYEWIYDVVKGFFICSI